MKFKQVTTLEYSLELSESEFFDASSIATKANIDVPTLLTALTSSGLHHAKMDCDENDKPFRPREVDDDGNEIAPNEWPAGE